MRELTTDTCCSPLQVNLQLASRSSQWRVWCAHGTDNALLSFLTAALHEAKHWIMRPPCCTATLTPHNIKWSLEFLLRFDFFFFVVFFGTFGLKKKKKWGKVMLGLNRIPSLRAAQIQRCGSPAGARLSPRSSSCQNAGASSRIYCACLLLLLLVTPRVDSSWWWVCIHHTYWPTCYTDLFTTSSSLLR